MVPLFAEIVSVNVCLALAALWSSEPFINCKNISLIINAIKNKIIITPDIWLNQKEANMDDIVPHDWIRISHI